MSDRVWGLIAATVLMPACQSYDFIYQPDADRQGTHLRFVVEQPSEADILFVIDNSVSMTEEQQALRDSIDILLAALAPQDTRYRIGIVSTDAIGTDSDCSGQPLTGPNNPGAKGNCDPLSTASLRRPHDGALGRLIAAYDPAIFDVNATVFDALNSAQKAALAKALPDSATTHPAEFTAFQGRKGTPGARWVIDRETIKLEACQACDCTTGNPPDLTCNEQDACFNDCADVIAPKIVEAYFRANVRGLGINGKGWEEGLKNAALAVGVDPSDPDDQSAINPANDLTRPPDGPNTFLGVDVFGNSQTIPWIRDEALLAVMFVTDEEDCSMGVGLWDKQCEYEDGCGLAWVPPSGWVSQPVGSMCYQPDVQPYMLGPGRIATLITAKKDDSVGRIAVGFIGGVQKTGVPPLEARSGEAVDCAVSTSGAPTTDCSCVDGVDPADPDCNKWCLFTQNTNGTCGPTPNPPACDALAGSRYTRFANRFRRRTFESVCLAEGGGFGGAMADFARIATLACFDLEEDVRPAANDPALIQVKRASRQDAEAGLPPTLLPMRDPEALDAGWYYDPADNKICLTGLDRLIGDVYDIFVLHTDRIQYSE